MKNSTSTTNTMAAFSALGRLELCHANVRTAQSVESYAHIPTTVVKNVIAEWFK